MIRAEKVIKWQKEVYPPHFDAIYIGVGNSANWPAILAIFTTLPPFLCATKCPIANCVRWIGCVRLMSSSLYRDSATMSADSPVSGGIQKLLKASSNTPAPGHTMSMAPKARSVASRACWSCVQDVTSHFSKTALALVPEVLVEVVELMKSWASARRDRSAMRTLQ